MSGSLISAVEFEALPPLIQRKYFSSVERLRIAGATAKQHGKPTSRGLLKHSPSFVRSRTSRQHDAAFVSDKGSHAHHSPRSSHAPECDRPVTQVEAVWFLSLPDKVRRQHYTQEEQILIKARCEVALLDAPLSVQRQFQDSHGPDFYNGVFDEYGIDDVESTVPELYGQQQRRNTYAAAPRRSADKINRSPTTASFDHAERSLFSTRLSMPPATKAPWQSPSCSPRQQSSFPISRSASTATPIYYKDPGARSKLRECMASPERFDEALEFGFVRTTSTPLLDAGSASGASIHSEAHSIDSRQRSMHSAADGLMESSDDEDMDAPSTPDTGSHTVSPSLTRLPVISPGFSHSSTLGSFGETSMFGDQELFDRDMTLKMTLTRPEIRTLDDDVQISCDAASTALYGKELRDPLALEELVFSDDVTGMHGAFAKSGGGQKRLKAMWRSISKG